jgi:uncharacterized OB-fold protein
MSDPLPLRPGLIADGDPPRLLGGRCRACGHPHFPRQEACPYCASEDTVAADLSTGGRLWAWTAVTHAPPGYAAEVPYGFGVVELPEGLRVVTRLTEADPERLRRGQKMRMVVVTLAAGDERRALSYAFAPVDDGTVPVASAATEPAATEPAATEPAATQPAMTERAATEPATTAGVP